MGQRAERAKDLYARRLDELARDSGVAVSRSRMWRLTLISTLVATVGVAYASFISDQLPLWTLGLFLPLFALTAGQVGKWRKRGVELFTVAEYYTQCVARVERKWDVLDRGEEFIDRDHLYAMDLDLFGRGSLFQILCSTRTQAGREVLAEWMTTPASEEEVTARQAASAELRDRRDLRERLSAVAGTTAADCHPDTFRTWVSRSLAHRRFASWIPPAAFLLSLGVVVIQRGTSGLRDSICCSAK